MAPHTGTFVASVLAISLLSSVAARAQAPVMFKVRVLDASTNEPLQGVDVTFRCFDAYPRSTRFTDNGSGITDAKGEVVATLSEPGVCILYNTLKAGFSQRLRENVRPTEIETGEGLRVVRLWKQATAEGRLLDEQGRPIAGAVVLLRYRDSSGRADWVTSLTGSTTDAQGNFRFDRLAASSPYSFVLPELQFVEPAPTVVLNAGESRKDLELRGRRVSSFRVAGRVVADDGTPVKTVVHFDDAASPEGFPSVVAAAPSDAEGRFAAPKVPRGTYRVRIDTGGPASPGRLGPKTLWASVPLALETDVDDLQITVRPVPMVWGRVVFEGSTPVPAGRILIGLDATGGPGGRITSGGMVEVDGERRFATGGLRPGQYLVRIALSPAGFRMKSAMTGGRDASVFPFDLSTQTVDDLVVTFTDRQTELKGTVRRGADQPDSDATVFLFPTDPALWVNSASNSRLVRTLYTTGRGTYGVADLPPGEYFAAAISSDDPMQGPTVIAAREELLRRLVPVATRLRLEYDTPLTIDLRRGAPAN